MFYISTVIRKNVSSSILATEASSGMLKLMKNKAINEKFITFTEEMSVLLSISASSVISLKNMRNYLLSTKKNGKDNLSPPQPLSIWPSASAPVPPGNVRLSRSINPAVSIESEKCAITATELSA
jgi:hypothetical protein